MQLSYSEAIKALNEGFVLLIARLAFASEEELREHYPPNEDEQSWAEKAKPWYQKRRHLYVICMNPNNSAQYFTSTADLDKTSWTLTFCSDNDPITQLDIRVALLEASWNKYHATAILLAKEDYPSKNIADAIALFRRNLQKLTYSSDENTGYDCQTATRDILQAANPSINAKELMLPPATDILAYKSSQSLCACTKETILNQFSGENKTEYYRLKNLQNWRKIEAHSLFSAIRKSGQDLAGKSICDLGCGNGFYSRKCIEQGAERVEGFDLSEDMIQEANSQVQDPNIEKYTACDVLQLSSVECLKNTFDIVLVVYLWNYAKNPFELRQLMEITFSLLKAGGIVYVVTDNKVTIPDYSPYQKYGMYREPNVIPAESDIEGLQIDYIFGENKALGHRLTNYRMSKETIEHTAKVVGFDHSNIAWHEINLPTELQDEREDWEVFLNAPPINIYSLLKP